MRSLLQMLSSFAFAGALISCKSAPATKIAAVPLIDTAIYAILPYDSSAMLAMSWRYKDARPGLLTQTEVEDIEILIDSAYRAFTRDSAIYLHDLLPLTGYRRQYVAVTTSRGEKEVWVNFFCSDFNVDWRHRALSVDDGGKCFFQLFINLTHRKAYDLIPGGDA